MLSKQGGMKMDKSLANVFQALIICGLIFGAFFSISSCEARDTEAREKTKQNYNELERCIDSCPVGWSKDKDCVDRCLEMEEIRLVIDLMEDYNLSEIMKAIAGLNVT